MLLQFSGNNFVKNEPKFENNSLFDAKFYELDMKQFSDPKALTFGVWGLKTSLGQSGPKAFGRGLIKALAPIFTNKTSFSQDHEMNPLKS